MSVIVVDEELRKRLGDLTQTVEFRDAGGKLLGRFTPDVLAKYEPWIPEIDEAEMDRVFASKEKGYTTAEVLAYLEKR